MTALNLTGYHLTFDDEFNSFVPTELGGPTWDVTIFSGDSVYGSQNYTDGPDGGLNAYLDAGGVDPFSVGNGVLSITATPNEPGATSDYTTGLIDNRSVFSQEYGYFEMRAELPAGAGLWPGFWMLPTVDNNGGVPEIDAMEAFGAQYGMYGGSNQVHYNVHSGTNPDEEGTWATVNANIYTSYNTYGVMWTPTTLTFYFDGQSIGSLPTPADLVGGSGEYLLGSLLTGSPDDWPGPMAGETGTMKIDYIRAFSSDASVPAVALQPISSPDGGGTNLYGATTAAGSAPTTTDPAPTTTDSAPTTTDPAPTVTITPAKGSPVTLSITGPVSSSGDTFNLAGGIVSAVLGTSKQTISFVGAPGVTATGGKGKVVITVDGGTNNFTAGAGGMEVTGTAGSNTFHFLQGAGLLTIDNFTASDVLVAPVALKGEITETTVKGGSMLETVDPTGGSSKAVYLPNVAHFDLSQIEYQ